MYRRTVARGIGSEYPVQVCTAVWLWTVVIKIRLLRKILWPTDRQSQAHTYTTLGLGPAVQLHTCMHSTASCVDVLLSLRFLRRRHRMKSRRCCSPSMSEAIPQAWRCHRRLHGGQDAPDANAR